MLAESSIRHIAKPVWRLTRSTVNHLYRVYVDGIVGPFYAKEVVSGIGVGGHTPRGIRESLIARKDSEVETKPVMDMDFFTSVADRLEKTDRGVKVGRKSAPKGKITLILSGGNGAIDVAFDALNKGYKVHWIVGSNGPKFLPGFFNLAAYLPYLRSLDPGDYAAAGFGGDTEEARAEKVEKEIARVKKLLGPLYDAQRHDMFSGVVRRFLPETTKFEGVYFGRVKGELVTASAGRVKVPGVGSGGVEGDLMVYGVGQDNKTFGLLENVMKDLVPERDVSGRFGAPGEATIGLASRDRSLRVVGATAFRLAPDVKPDEGQVKAAEDAVWEGYQAVKKVEDANLPAAPFRKLWLAYRKYQQAFGTPDADSRLKTFTGEAKKFDGFIGKLDRSKLSAKQETAVDLTLGALGEARTNMEPVVRSLPGNVLINDQLTPTRSQVEASRGFLPYDIGRNASFVTDDRTALTVHITARYPKLAAKDGGHWAGKTAAKIVASRNRDVAGGPDFASLLSGVPAKERSVPPYGRAFQRAWRDYLEQQESGA